ncbi:tRNA uridine(34) 5-carboxymethylaminomethyl modification radical SAM/GNAT enzyme Elp3 [archaeon]|nr:tRNA uridine(34) 5-carboxymethylaminomethyl modification radical SAM/GNAT enzyme Elp3 [archaeon]
MNFYQELAKEIRSGKVSNRAELERRKKQLCKKYRVKDVPGNIELLENLGLKRNFLLKKPSRSISGVSVVAIMTKPQPCPGNCIYCPRGKAAQSYTGEEPAALRARQANFSACKQVEARLNQLSASGHPTSKIELIVMGATFTAMPNDYQESFMLDTYNALNTMPSTSLKKAQTLNEKTKHRCIGLTFEVRPDYSKETHIQRMLSFGATRVELGVQTINNEIYKKVKRGHTVQDVEEATQLLKDSFIKVGYHMMPGLPFSNAKQDVDMFKTIFSADRFKPDMLKIYPCLLAKREFYDNPEIYDLYKQGKWVPLDDTQAIEIIAQAKAFFPKWVRVMRIQRDIPKPYIEAGVTAGNLRELVKKRTEELDIHCRCIRCNEIRDRKSGKPKLLRQEYNASGGREIFLSFEYKAHLLAMLRLRKPGNPFRKEIDDHTMGIRELRVYGPEVAVGKDSKDQQHHGLGKQLLEEAERIAKEDFDAKKMLVLSGVGVRDYYRKNGYSSEGVYMSKLI